MTNLEKLKKFNSEICYELNNNIKIFGKEYSENLFESQKEFIELGIIGEAKAYNHLIQKKLIHQNFCLLCGDDFNNNNKMKFDLFDRFYYLCKSCYSRENNFKQTSSNEGCYIATMVYGNYEHPKVILLRGFRDDYLSKSKIGRYFIKFYYHFSPKLVSRFKNARLFNDFSRLVLDSFIKLIK